MLGKMKLSKHSLHCMLKLISGFRHRAQPEIAHTLGLAFPACPHNPRVAWLPTWSKVEAGSHKWLPSRGGTMAAGQERGTKAHGRARSSLPLLFSCRFTFPPHAHSWNVFSLWAAGALVSPHPLTKSWVSGCQMLLMSALPPFCSIISPVR